MGSASWIQEGTPALPPWHPRSAVFYQLTLYPLVNWSPSLETLVPGHYCGEPPRTHSLHSSSQLDTHKVLVHRKSKHKSPQSSFMAGFYRQWSCLQLCQVCQSASSSLLTLYWDFSLSHIPKRAKWVGMESSLCLCRTSA